MSDSTRKTQSHGKEPFSEQAIPTVSLYDWEPDFQTTQDLLWGRIEPGNGDPIPGQAGRDE